VDTQTTPITRTAILDSEVARRHPPAGGAAESSFRVSGLTRDIRVRIATERSELEGASALLAPGPRARGAGCPGNESYLLTPHRGLPGTVTLVAVDAGRVVATLSLVPDSADLGLPMERLYGPEITHLRQDGRRLAEAVGLADAGLTIREFVQVFKALCTLAVQYHAGRGGDTWVIAIDPRHRNFYERVMGFVPLGPQGSSPTVQDQEPSSGAYLLDLELMAANAPQMYREVFEDPLPAAVLAAPRH
jgi:hypothetical protein